MCDSNTIRRVPTSHLAAEAAQQRPAFTSDALAAIKHFRQCCAGDRQALMPKPHLYDCFGSVTSPDRHIHRRLHETYLTNYYKTGIAKFYIKFLSFIKLDPALPDPTRGSTRPACNSDLRIWTTVLSSIFWTRCSLLMFRRRGDSMCASDDCVCSVDLRSTNYTVSQKTQYTWLLIITSTNVDQFTKFFHC